LGEQMFFYKSLDKFNIKKGRGLFLYDYSGNKIKYTSNNDLLFNINSKYYISSYKNNISYGILFPMWKEIKTCFLNKIFIKPDFIRKSDNLERWEKDRKNLKVDISNIIQNKFDITFNYTYTIASIIKYNRDKNIVFFIPEKDHLFYKNICKLFTENSLYEKCRFISTYKEFDELKNIDNLFLYTYTFPYWLKLEEIHLLQNNFEDKDLHSSYYEIVKNFKDKMVLLKNKGAIIALDGNKTEFVNSQFLLFFDIRDFYNSWKNYFDNNVWDYYLFGKNISASEDFSLVLKKDEDQDITNYVSVYSPAIAKTFIDNYERLFNLKLYENFYDKIKLLVDEDIEIIGPYFTSYNFIKNFDNIKKIWEVSRIYSDYQLMKLPLDVREEDIKSIITTLKKLN